MWVAEFRIKHNCILGNRCKKFGVSLQSIVISTFNEGKNVITSSMHFIISNEKSAKAFVADLKKDKNVILLEDKKDMFFLLEKADSKAVAFYNPKIIFVKPAIINSDGTEYWEIASWDKKEITQFLDGVKKKISDFQLKRISNKKMDNIFFPKLIPDLTDKQKDAIQQAIKYGYYKSPKEISLRELAKKMGLSLSTYQKHLSVAEEKILPNLTQF